MGDNIFHLLDNSSVRTAIRHFILLLFMIIIYEFLFLRLVSLFKYFLYYYFPLRILNITKNLAAKMYAEIVETPKLFTKLFFSNKNHPIHLATLNKIHVCLFIVVVTVHWGRQLVKSLRFFFRVFKRNRVNFEFFFTANSLDINQNALLPTSLLCTLLPLRALLCPYLLCTLLPTTLLSITLLRALLCLRPMLCTMLRSMLSTECT